MCRLESVQTFSESNFIEISNYFAICQKRSEEWRILRIIRTMTARQRDNTRANEKKDLRSDITANDGLSRGMEILFSVVNECIRPFLVH